MIEHDHRVEAWSLSGMLGIAAVCWVLSVTQMRGMDMGVATALGSLGFFAGVWAAMMTAMMLPGAAPAILRQARARRRTAAAPSFAAAYLCVWILFGLAVYCLYRPHSSLVAGAVTIAAGGYELTPVKRHARRRCRQPVRSGFHLGLYCIGSSIGLMLLLLAVGVMSPAWMAAVAVLVLVQKALPPRAAVDIPLALAIVGLGIVILIAPSLVPGLIPSM